MSMRPHGRPQLSRSVALSKFFSVIITRPCPSPRLGGERVRVKKTLFSLSQICLGKISSLLTERNFSFRVVRPNPY